MGAIPLSLGMGIMLLIGEDPHTSATICTYEDKMSSERSAPYSTKELAEAVDVTPTCVHKLCKEGKLLGLTRLGVTGSFLPRLAWHV